MIIVLCHHCSLTVRVMGDSDEVQHLVGERSDFWPDRYPCPRCGRHAVGNLEQDILAGELARFHVRDLTPQEALAAFHGFGLPSEQRCTKETVETLLRENPIRRVAAKNIEGAERCYVQHLELWDGTKIYFGAGPDGAVIYRIAPPYSYTEKVSHELQAG